MATTNQAYLDWIEAGTGYNILTNTQKQAQLYANQAPTVRKPFVPTPSTTPNTSAPAPTSSAPSVPKPSVPTPAYGSNVANLYLLHYI